MKKSKYSKRIVIGCFALIISSLFGCGFIFLRITSPPSLPSNVATIERPAPSFSGNYELWVEETVDRSGFPVFKFQVREQNGNVVFQSTDEYSARHTTFFLWDEQDRVWVYSGDVGTFFWEQSAEGGWIKNMYPHLSVPAPEFLKEVRPKSHSSP